MHLKLKLIFLVLSVSFALCGPMEKGTEPEDEIIDPEDGLEGATAPAPLAFLEQWDEWQTWEAPEKILKMAHYYKSGYDYDGLPVIVAQFGKWNYRELAQLEPDKVNDFLRYYEQFVRRAQSEGAANNDAGIVFICDWDGFSLGSYASTHALKLALNTMTSIVRFDHVIQYAYQINMVPAWIRTLISNFNDFSPANFGAETFVNMARPFLGQIVAKFEVFGGRREKWRVALLRKIPSSQLPPEYGGDKDWKAVPWNNTKLLDT